MSLGCDGRLTEGYIVDALRHKRVFEADLPPTASYRRAAVLVPMICEEDEWHLLFTRRSDKLISHSGQVSFPGGAADGDLETAEETALREACEEISLHRRDVRLLGRMGDYLTISSFLVTPVVGMVRWPIPLSPQSGEVNRIFSIPISWLANPQHWEERSIEVPFLPEGVIRQVIYYQLYDGELLWGITARITQHLLELLGLISRRSQ